MLWSLVSLPAAPLPHPSHTCTLTCERSHIHACTHTHLWNPRQPQAAHRSDRWRNQGCHGYWGDGAVSMDSSPKHEPLLTSANLTKAEPSWAVSGFRVSELCHLSKCFLGWESGHVLSVASADPAQGSRGVSFHHQTTEPWGPRWNHHVFSSFAYRNLLEPTLCRSGRAVSGEGKNQKGQWGFYWFIWYPKSNNWFLFLKVHATNP